MHGMAKQGRQTLNDGEPEPEAATSLASGIVELMIFAEDRLKIMLGYADAGIPDLDAQQFRRDDGSRAVPCHASCISERLTGDCEASARADVDRCKPKALHRRRANEVVRLRMIREFIPQTGQADR